jgi:hypothetical protein
MKKSRLLILSSIIFCVCCAMSKCNIPGPETTVQGTVTDYLSGQPVANMQMYVVNALHMPYVNGSNLVTTNADGSFYFKFTPTSQGTIYLEPVEAESNRYVLQTSTTITQGQVNTFAIKTYEMVDVTFHLINNSSQNRSNYFFDVSSTRYGTFFELFSPNIKKDTVFHSFLPQLAQYKVKSDFLNANANAGSTDSVNFYTVFNLSKVDTIVNVVNP